MPKFLRAAIYDAAAFNADGSIRSPQVTLMLKNQHTFAKSKEL